MDYYNFFFLKKLAVLESCPRSTTCTFLIFGKSEYTEFIQQITCGSLTPIPTGSYKLSWLLRTPLYLIVGGLKKLLLSKYHTWAF